MLSVQMAFILVRVKCLRCHRTKIQFVFNIVRIASLSQNRITTSTCEWERRGNSRKIKPVSIQNQQFQLSFVCTQALLLQYAKKSLSISILFSESATKGKWKWERKKEKQKQKQWQPRSNRCTFRMMADFEILTDPLNVNQRIFVW